MADLFVYGTLRDLYLARIVLGRAVRAQAASLSGYAVYWAQGQSFPFIEIALGSTAKGLLFYDLTQDDFARLNFYEGGFGYDLLQVAVLSEGRDIPAQVYVPRPGLWDKGAPWSLRVWQEHWGPLTRDAAQEAMGYFGQISAETLAAKMPQIRQRADARQRGAATPRNLDLPSTLTARDVRLAVHRRPYTGYFAIEEAELRFTLFGGGESAQVTRGVFVGGDSVAVLPYDPLRDQVLLIEQFRPGPFLRCDPNSWTFEPVAGRIDPRESPEQTAHREAFEEAGIEISQLHQISSHYPSAGSSTEYFTVYLGMTDLGAVPQTAGLATEDEDIRLHVMDYARFEQLLDADTFDVGPLVLAGHALARKRNGLMASSAG